MPFLCPNLEIEIHDSATMLVFKESYFEIWALHPSSFDPAEVPINDIPSL